MIQRLKTSTKIPYYGKWVKITHENDGGGRSGWGNVDPPAVPTKVFGAGVTLEN